MQFKEFIAWWQDICYRLRVNVRGRRREIYCFTKYETVSKWLTGIGTLLGIDQIGPFFHLFGKSPGSLNTHIRLQMCQESGNLDFEPDIA